MHQVQKITLRRKREKRNTNTSGEYILTSKVVPLVTRFFGLFGNLAAKSECIERKQLKSLWFTRAVRSHGVLPLLFTTKSGS